MTVISAWAEHAAGPGWSNRLVWVLSREDDGSLDLRGLQMDELDERTRTLMRVSEVVSAEMTASVRSLLASKR